MTHLFQKLAQTTRAFVRLANLTSWWDAVRFVAARSRGQQFVEVRLKEHNLVIALRPRNSDFDVLLQTFVSGGCDVRQWIHSPHRIIDGGANIGLTAIQFANHFPMAEILAIEPEPANFALLVRNTSAFPNIRPLQGALWPRVANLEISPANADGRSWAFQTQEGSTPGSSLGCASIPINDLVSPSQPADLVKLDIEGAEWPLLEETDLQWLRASRVLVLELHGPNADDRFQRALQGVTFECHRRHEKVILVQPPPVLCADTEETNLSA